MFNDYIIRLGPADEPYESETVLSDDYPIYIEHFYIIDGDIALSQIKGSVKDLKDRYNIKEIRRCDIVKRGLYT